jgi:Spy/CpxP family protein refolding chaperone
MSKTNIFLSISILLNIFLIGYLAGTQLEHKDHHRHPEMHGPMNKELRLEMKTKRNELFEIVTAPEFNEAIFDTKILEIEALHDQVKAEMPERLKQKVLGKTQDQRIKLIKTIKRKHRHRN